jgi:hypothetical protein
MFIALPKIGSLLGDLCLISVFFTAEEGVDSSGVIGSGKDKPSFPLDFPDSSSERITPGFTDVRIKPVVDEEFQIFVIGWG